MRRFSLPHHHDADRHAAGASGDTTAKAETEYRRRAQALVLICALMWLVPPGLSAQSNTKIHGHVFNRETGSPVAGATISIPGTAYATTSDNFGEFSFEHLAPDVYTITISSIGYKDYVLYDIRVVTDVTARVIARLIPEIYYLGKFSVREKQLPPSGYPVTVMDKAEIIRTQARDLPDLLTTVDGVYIQRTGAAFSRAEIRIRGSTPKQVLVLVDGQRISPSGEAADLSTIPLELVERLEVHKGGASAEFGPDALGGAINIITRPQADDGLGVETGRAWGSWKTERYRLTVVNPLPLRSFSGKLGYSLNQSVADFPFSYTAPPHNVLHKGTRINNRVDAYNYFASGVCRFSDRFFLNYSGQYYRGIHGLPHWASKQIEHASSTDRRKIAVIGLQYNRSPWHSLNLDLGFSRFQQHFVDRETEPEAYQFDSHYLNDVITLRHAQRLIPWRSHQIRLGMEYRRGDFDHQDALNPRKSMGESKRDNIGVFLSGVQYFDLSRLRFIDQLSVDAAIRFDRTETRKDSTTKQDTVRTNSVASWSPKVGFAIAKGTRFSYVLRASYGKSLRIPSLSALFWKSDNRAAGNPGLKPERSEHSEAGFELAGAFKQLMVSCGMTYFHSFVTDLIIWVPSLGVWRPENREKAQITGHEDFLELSLFGRRVTVRYQNTITTPLNKSSKHTLYNNHLVFAPHYVTRLTTRLDTEYLFGSYSIRWCDRAYIKEENTRPYDPYRVDDLSLGVRFPFSSLLRVTADLKIHNLRDVNYVLITHYPMPGREWNIEIGMTYGLFE
ncbi:MAG: TonB-dependent receptor, partial [Candidatus Zixiibacteriota bacterium]